MLAQRMTWVVRPNMNNLKRIVNSHFYGAYSMSTKTKPPQVDIDDLLKQPSWSVRDTLFKNDSNKATTPVSKEQLHHLLRLSALPLPKSSDEEAQMIRDLQAQLKFVQAIQEVDTEGLEPLQMIRDETREGRKANTITMDTLKEEFAKEEVVGKRGRIRKKTVTKEQKEYSIGEDWNPLSHTDKTEGPYFVVDTAKD